MSRKALIVRFKNARIFSDPRRSSDKMISGRAKIDRRVAPRINIPEGTLDTRHVSNLLHVLAGERPVPTLRASCMQRDREIYDLARESLVKVEEVGRDETKTVRKAVKDSWNTVTLWYHLNGKNERIKGGLIYHDRLRRYLGNDLYGRFMEVLEGVSGCDDPRRDFSAHEAIEYLNAHCHDRRVVSLVALCRSHQRSAIANLLEPGGNVKSIDIHQGTGSKINTLVVNSGVEKVRTISGTVYVPIDSDAALERFKGGGGVATFLEGGFAYIEGVDDWSEDLTYGCQQVKEGEMVNVSDRIG
jgi:hypothetical protein